MPLVTALQWRVTAATATASLRSSSLVPYSVETWAWKYVQYLHGICAATASPISSLVLPGSAVFGLSSSDLSSPHAPAIAASGTDFMKVGTMPSVFWIDRKS